MENNYYIDIFATLRNIGNTHTQINKINKYELEKLCMEDLCNR